MVQEDLRTGESGVLPTGHLLTIVFSRSTGAYSTQPTPIHERTRAMFSFVSLTASAPMDEDMAASLSGNN